LVIQVMGQKHDPLSALVCCIQSLVAAKDRGHRDRTKWNKRNRHFQALAVDKQTAFIHSFIRFLMTQQAHQSRAMTTSQNRDIMRNPGRKGR